MAWRPGPLNPGKRAITASANRVAENLWADPLSNPSKPLSSLAGKLPGAGKRASAGVLVPYDISTRLALASPSSSSAPFVFIGSCKLRASIILSTIKRGLGSRFGKRAILFSANYWRRRIIRGECF